MSDATGQNENPSAAKTLELDPPPVPPQAPEVDIEALAASTGVSIEEYLALRKSVFSDEKQENRLRRALTKLETEKGFESDAELRVKYGVFLWILRRTEAAEEQFLQCRTNITGAYFLGRCLLDTNRCSEAKVVLKKTFKRKPNSLACALTLVTALEKVGEMDEALKMLKELKKAHKKDDDILFHLGFVYDYQGFHEKADEFYDKALNLNSFNEGALFRKAYLADLYGNEDEAFTLYRRCLEVNPPNANAVINLGILHEDKGEFRQAIECYENVLKTYPTHPRALTFLEDAVASLDMHVDEEREKKDDRLAQILRIPVTDFELSVRSRNCLKKMEILTLGDLIIKTEAELLSYKNFGETSLAEIKTILDSKGLNLGMDHDSIDTPPPRIDIADLFNAGGADTRTRPIGDLGLSIRARKCMDTLNVRSVGDLIDKTESELLKCSNFGLTSLHDVKQKLAQFGVDLARE